MPTFYHTRLLYYKTPA